jgi:hypothetical protein
MTALAVFCAGTVLFLVPRDLLFVETREVEVWLGFEVRGSAARLTAPLHWAIFTIGAWASWTQRPWIVPAAAAYAFLVAVSHGIWNLASPKGRGWTAGLAQAALFSIPGILLLRAHRRATRFPAGG